MIIHILINILMKYYIFDNSQADVIVFEDLDRFEINEIFSKLREINELVNKKRIKNNNTTVKFFYLLRDDVFTSKDRTKFFDFILPIVPIVDGSNSYNMFIEYFENFNISNIFNKKFLQGISLYIDDMRLIKNICNEFIIYYNSLSKIELNANKMLSIIVYKNIFPKDFSNLQISSGFLYNLFNNINMFKQQDINSLQEQKQKKIQEIDDINSEHLETIGELNLVYEDKKEYFNSGYTRKVLNAYDEEQYQKRKKILEDRQNDNILNLEKNIELIESKISEVAKLKNIKSYLSRENIDQIFKFVIENELGEIINFNDVKKSDYFPLLKYLIRNGYIDESYSDYMTYFYENSLSRTDKIFLRSITDRNSKEFSYKLDNPEMIVERIDISEFSEKEVLNFDLFIYLFQKLDKIEFLKKFIKQLEDTRNFMFLGDFILFLEKNKIIKEGNIIDFKTPQEYLEYQYGNFKKIDDIYSLFVDSINKHWPKMFYESLNAKIFDFSSRRNHFIKYTLIYCDIEDIKNINIDDELSKYISEHNYFINLQIEDSNILSKIIKIMEDLDVKFTRLELYKNNNKDNTNVLEKVYMKSLYEINIHNLEFVLKKYHKIIYTKDLWEKNFTIITSDKESPLYNYIEENLQEYFDVMLSHIKEIDGRIQDLEEVVLSIVDNKNLNNTSKKTYFEYVDTIIENVEYIKDRTLFSEFYSRNIVEYSPINIIEYFKTYSLDDILIKFINEGRYALDYSNLKNKYDMEIDGKNLYETFCKSLIMCNNLYYEKYKEIFSTIGFTVHSLNSNAISEDKIEILIYNNIIKMNDKTLSEIRGYYPNLVFDFIKVNIEDYASITTIENFNLDELKEILKWDTDTNVQLKLLGLTSEKISILEKRYTVDINKYILENNLDEKDIGALITTYNEWDIKIQEVIEKIAIEKISTIFNDASYRPNISLTRKLLHSSDISHNNKIELFISRIKDFQEYDDEIIAILKTLKLEKFTQIFDFNKNPRFEINEDNQRLLEAFKSIGKIKKYNIHKNGKEYTIRRS